ncbi:hypothetical protein [Naasia aerilata]|uniref:Uncharacterized protein n=1 Tax=Naasia aerilata TaxID=1162966 RepID=A0ABN6XIU1_9MICO|nr:hypothetical protein [Naasia aerilata]BDZ44802.1 hypothetical protein GCM10025866_07110 [Naasia aerilata]
MPSSKSTAKSVVYLNLAWKALHSPQGRAIARKAADGIAGAGNRVTGNRFEAQIEKGRAAVHSHFAEPEPKRRGPFKRR